MDALTRDRIFGTGRGPEGMRGVFAPAGTEPAQKGDILASYRGPGRDKVLGFLEQRNFITAEQRAANGAAASGVDELVDIAGTTTHGLAGATSAASAGTQQYANPIYHGLMAQTLMREHGFVAPTTAPDGMASGAVERMVMVGGQNGDEMRVMPAAAAAAAGVQTADAPIAAAADDVATHVAAMEQRMLSALQRLGELPQDAKIPALTRAVDATAAHGGDTYDVLARTLLDRPLDDAVLAFERSLDDAAKVVAPRVDDAAKAAPTAAKVVEAAVPKVVAAAQPRLIAVGGDDALRGVMSFSAGIDDTLRMLAKF